MSPPSKNTSALSRPTPGNPGRREMASGARAMAPMMLSYLPFGLLLGTAVARCANPWAAWSGTGLIYGGSSHLTLIEMLRTGSGVWAAVGAALLINARLLVYSSSLMPLWRSARLPIRLLAAAVIIDPTWLVASRRAELGGSPTLQRAHFAGAATVLTIGWIAAVTAGMFLRSSWRPPLCSVSRCRCASPRFWCPICECLAAVSRSSRPAQSLWERRPCPRGRAPCWPWRRQRSAAH